MFRNAALLVYGTTAVLLGAFAAPKSAYAGLGYRTCMVWLCIIPLIVLFQQPLYILFAYIMLLILTAPTNAIDRVKFFALIVPAAPLYIETILPLPGINNVFTLSSYNSVVLAVLLAALFAGAKERQHTTRWSTIDSCVVLYFAYSILQTGLTYGIVSGARLSLGLAVAFVIPYLAIRKTVASERDVCEVLSAFVAAAIMLAVIALVSMWKSWDYYRISALDELGGFVEARDGRLRIQATIGTHSLAYTLLLGLLLLQHVKNHLSLGLFRLWGLRALLLLGALTPGSKGALLGFAVGCAVYFLLSIRSTSLRWVLLICFAAAGLIGSSELIFSDFSSVDDHGSVGYRQLLIVTALDFIVSYPLFGNLRFLESGHFDVLMQGQGIIDITNMYLQVLLSYGLIGGLLFFGPIFFIFIRLSLRAMTLSKCQQEEFKEVRGAYVAICSGLAGWLVLIATTSDVGLVFHLGLFLLAIGEGMRRNENWLIPGKRITNPLMHQYKWSDKLNDSFEKPRA